MSASRLGAVLPVAHKAVRAVERTGRELAGQQAMALVGARQPKRAGRFHREAKAPVIGGIADKQYGAMLAPPRGRDGAPRQRAANAAATPRLVHSERTEQYRRPARAGAHVPWPDRADD